MRAITGYATGNRQLLVGNLSPVEEGEPLVPEIESILDPFRNDMLIGIALSRQDDPA